MFGSSSAIVCNVYVLNKTHKLKLYNTIIESMNLLYHATSEILKYTF